MPQHQEWRLEKYMDEMDPFGTVQFYVMHGSVLLAQCEVEAHAVHIITEHERLVRYEQVLAHISAMTPDSHDLEAAIAAALRALEAGD